MTMTWDFSIYFVEEIKSLTNGNENQGVFHTMGSATVLLFGRQDEPRRHRSMLLYLHAACPYFSELDVTLKRRTQIIMELLYIRNNMCKIEHKLLIFRINNLPISFAL